MGFFSSVRTAGEAGYSLTVTPFTRDSHPPLLGRGDTGKGPLNNHSDASKLVFCCCYCSNGVLELLLKPRLP